MGIAILVLADGAVVGAGAGYKYNFLMWLPFLVALMGTFVLLFVNPTHILSSDSDMDDEDAVKKDKSMFFVGTLFLFTSICLAVWKAVDPYGGIDEKWAGAALPVASVIILLMNVALFSSRARREDDL